MPQPDEYSTSLDAVLDSISTAMVPSKEERESSSRPIINTAAAAHAQPSSPATPSTPRRRAAAHMASPTDIKPSTPGARRMSQSSTPQAAVTPEGILDRVLDRPVMVMAGVVSTVVLTGTMYSLIYSTALNTSINSHLPERTAYFARKSNLFNQLFVKRSWFWTTLVYLTHLFTSPAAAHDAQSLFSIESFRKNGRWSRLVAWVVATGCWVVFTSWFFGAGLGDRIIELSGGSCAVAVPAEWGLDRQALEPLLPQGMNKVLSAAAAATPGAQKSASGEQLYIPVPASLCAGRGVLSPSTHPDLFRLLGTKMGDKVARVPRPRWFKGFDISGHVFLLTLASLLLVRELVPSWKAWLQAGSTHASRQPIARLNDDSPTGWRRTVHRYTTAFGTMLLGLWVWMLLMTSVWFHNPPEKFTGLVIGLLASALVNTLTPELTPSRSVTEAGRPLLMENENAARRGRTDDFGVILEEDGEGEDSQRIPNGRSRQKVE